MSRGRVVIFIVCAMSVAVSVRAQQPQSPDSPEIERKEHIPPADDDLEAPPDITKWLPVEKFAQELQAAESAKFHPTTFSTSMVLPKAKVKSVRVMPDNNSIKFGQHFTISNGSAGNWGVPYPSAFLDARTLSFPPPR